MPRFSVIVEAMIAYPREIKLNAVVPRGFSRPIVLVETSTEILKIPCAIVTCIGGSDKSKPVGEPEAVGFVDVVR